MSGIEPRNHEGLAVATDPPAIRRLIITVHGIRTFGQWQERLGALVKQALPEEEKGSVRFLHWHFGYFSLLAFLVPPFRWLQTRRFRTFLEQQLSENKAIKVDIIAHSFGTHVVGWALMGIRPHRRPRGRIGTIILAGSVLKSWFPWDALIEENVVDRVVNECGTEDRILVLSQAFVLMTGMAGRMGFNGGLIDEVFVNRFYRLGHSGYFVRDGKPFDDFMTEQWTPLLTSDRPVPPVDQRIAGTRQGLIAFLLNNAEPIKFAVYSTPFLLVLAVVTQLWLQAKTAKEKAESAEVKVRDSLTKTLEANRRAEDRADMALEAIRTSRQALQENPDLRTRPELAALRRQLLKANLEFYKRIDEQLRDETDPAVRVKLALTGIEQAQIARQIGQTEAEEKGYRDRPRELLNSLDQSTADRTMLISLGTAYNRLGDLLLSERQVPDAGISLKVALGIFERLAREPGGEGDARILEGLARSNYNLGLFHHAEGDLAEALSRFKAASDSFEKLGTAGAVGEGYKDSVAWTLINISDSQLAANKFSDALENLSLASKRFEDALGRDKQNPAYEAGLAWTLANTGKVLRASGATEQAREKLSAAIDKFKTLEKSDPGDPSHMRSRAWVLVDYGDVCRVEGKLDEAFTGLIEAISLFDQLARDDESNPELAEGKFRARHNLAWTYKDRGAKRDPLKDADAALNDLREALQIFNDLQNQKWGGRYQKQGRAYALKDIGNLLLASRPARPAEALPNFLDAWRLFREIAEERNDADNRFALGLALMDVGNAERELGRKDEARDHFKRALVIFQDLHEKSPEARFKETTEQILSNLKQLGS